MTDRLTSMAVFVRAVEKGGFTAAAAEFGLSATMVGLHVRALEERMGGRLLNRTTRRQSLTEIGQAYYERCKQILADVEVAEAAATHAQASPHGRLRISAPVTFGVHRLMPALAEYLARCPQVEVDVDLSDRVRDLIDEGFEVAIRIGALADSGLVARELMPYRMAVAASPAYLKVHGTPHVPADLAQHNCLGFASWRHVDEWRFQGGGVDATVSVRRNLRANNGEALRMAALAGIGVIMQPEILLAEDVAAGRLVRLLENCKAPEKPMHLIYLPDRAPSAKLRSFIEFAVERFG